ncbi:hypothetical protein [Isoptericola sp. NPDC056134]|uniref:hypothetical protein n=1 Tax=Isoptericola sp. NPDC056134 TaxID=3345723 RepID=UPI0035E61C3B
MDKIDVKMHRSRVQGWIVFGVLLVALLLTGWLSWGTAALAGAAGLWWTKWSQGADGRERTAQQSRNSWG